MMPSVTGHIGAYLIADKDMVHGMKKLAWRSLQSSLLDLDRDLSSTWPSIYAEAVGDLLVFAIHRYLSFCTAPHCNSLDDDVTFPNAFADYPDFSRDMFAPKTKAIQHSLLKTKNLFRASQDTSRFGC